MPVSPRAVAHLTAAGHDAVRAHSIGLTAAADGAILEAAHADGRTVVTTDLDYPRVLALQRADSPGVILCPLRRIPGHTLTGEKHGFDRQER